jgi:hypothetical protein
MMLKNYYLYSFRVRLDHMNSPQPLSASQRGAKKLLPPFICMQEKGDGG